MIDECEGVPAPSDFELESMDGAAIGAENRRLRFQLVQAVTLLKYVQESVAYHIQRFFEYIGEGKQTRALAEIDSLSNLPEAGDYESANALRALLRQCGEALVAAECGLEELISELMNIHKDDTVKGAKKDLSFVQAALTALRKAGIVGEEGESGE